MVMSSWAFKQYPKIFATVFYLSRTGGGELILPSIPVALFGNWSILRISWSIANMTPIYYKFLFFLNQYSGILFFNVVHHFLISYTAILGNCRYNNRVFTSDITIVKAC